MSPSEPPGQFDWTKLAHCTSRPCILQNKTIIRPLRHILRIFFFDKAPPPLWGPRRSGLDQNCTCTTGYRWAILFLDFPVERNSSIQKILPVFIHHITENAKSTGTGSVCCSMWITQECWFAKFHKNWLIFNMFTGRANIRVIPLIYY